MTKINEFRKEDTNVNNEWYDRRWLKNRKPDATALETARFIKKTYDLIQQDVEEGEAREMAYSEVFT